MPNKSSQPHRSLRLAGWPAAVIIYLTCAQPSLPAQSATLTGQLSLIWMDPLDPGGLPQLHAEISTGPDSSARLVFNAGTQPSEGELLNMNGRTVRATGTWIAGDVRTGIFSPYALTSDRPNSAPEPNESSVVSGTQPFVTLLCRFGDFPAVTPNVKASFLTGSSFPSLDEYWRETSYNTVNLGGSAVTPWINLPNPRSYYIYDSDGNGTEDADLTRLVNDCTAAAAPSVSFSNFVGINMLFNQSIGGFWWGGTRRMTLQGVNKSWGVTWIGLAGTDYPFLAGLTHEVGHTFGLPHSSGPYSAVYDSYWDVMSYAYPHWDPTLREYIPEGTISYHKDLEGWIPAGRRFIAPPYSTTTVVLERLAVPISSDTYLMAKIPIGSSISHFYTVEFRQLVGHDAWLPGTAVLIHDVVSNRASGSPARVVDPDNNGNPNDAGAMWGAGETFNDTANSIAVSVVSLNATSATVTITNNSHPRMLPPADFDGDRKTDVTIFRPSTGEWFVRRSSTFTPITLVWGGGADKPVPGDYDGDGITDVAVFRPSTGEWFVRQSTTFTLVTLVWGGGSDIPVQADYDGDGKTDVAIFRPSTGQWFIRQSSTFTLQTIVWGGGSDIPVQADYDGDGKTDVAIFRPSTGEWFVRQSSTFTLVTLIWGGGSDEPVPGDYDGDGKADLAVFRPSTGEWFVRQSTTFTLLTIVWGGGSDIPVPGDYDGDGKFDVAIFRPSTGEWFVRQSSTFTLLTIVWGGGADVPILKRP